MEPMFLLVLVMSAVALAGLWWFRREDRILDEMKRAEDVSQAT
jgi:hypothetical protein